ncbi:RNA polymerase sigma factor [Aquimarina sp. 2201CG5-10]|uniref:RNA polymerase sigma factor n=1 Tax=Aquimarina callyspongiae TaxID=3098150 RepID=UPI002AB55922|nr:sigma-70 family RNA polymerase sigma factor [Aquimarina sp. 2201CG5-10]MDY8137789.1 sigma-70 family RNA polymerase sigma factor [Aquimarina sp. 2201CG5-10]
MENNENIKETLNHLFRQESGKMVSVLIKIFGIENIELAEDVVQDALVSALETWKYRGMPDNPRAWLYRTAKNKAIDIIRRKKHSKTIDFSDPQKQLLTSEYTLTATMNDFWQEEHIQDDFLAMMYACCHPEISQESQITFILKSLCGFSTKEVARSFLTTEATISKRLYRTKEYFRKNKIRPQIPEKETIVDKTTAVVNAVYLMFNEGYSSTHTDQLIREDLISQSMLLCKSLLTVKRTQLPEVYALMALMCFHTARLESRVTSEGKLILLSDQDRKTWNEELIKVGNSYLNKAAFGDTLTTYHVEAAIAYQHCIARTYKETNWEAILEYYNLLLKITNDPIVYLNRCLAILELKGPKEALKTISELNDNKILTKYYLFPATVGEIHQRLGQPVKAIENYKKALGLTQSKPEQQLLKQKIATVLN